MARRWSREDQNTMIEALEHQGGEMTRREEALILTLRGRFDAGDELEPELVEQLERVYRRHNR